MSMRGKEVREGSNQGAVDRHRDDAVPASEATAWTSSAESIAPLRDFVAALTRLAPQFDQAQARTQAGELLRALIAIDGWLPDAFAQPHPDFYQQYLLHCDPLERFSVVSFVWGPGQRTPIHNHEVWGIVGILRGAENVQRYAPDAAGRLRPAGDVERLDVGDIDYVSPQTGDWHVVENAVADATSISIHVYGANIGAVRRSVYDTVTRQTKPFISGYSSTMVPNLWDRSRAGARPPADSNKESQP